jgi:uncharacterized SAM-binding protein YcdF (DUF218 family)
MKGGARHKHSAFSVSTLIYIIKFLYSTFLLPPGIFILVLIFICLKLHKNKNKFLKPLILFTFIFYASSIPLVTDSIISSLERQYIPPQNPKGDVIIMLGGGATLDTPNLDFKGHLSGYSSNRLLTTLELYKRLNVPIIISGGKVFESSGTESEIGRNILTAVGVPTSNIIIDDRSINTTENAKYTNEILQKYNFKNPILVTSAFHMPRAVKQFEKFKVKVTPYPTDYQTDIHKVFEMNDLIPSGDSMSKLSLAVKEYIGLFAAKIY